MRFEFNHFNINVTDLDRSLDFYSKALGLREVRRHTAGDGSFTLAFITDEKGHFSLELTCLHGKEGRYELGDNESHLCMKTTDKAAAHELHREMGVICFENEAMGLYFIEDPDGYWIEII